MTKVKNQPRKQKQSAAHTPSRAETHDKSMLADMKAGQQGPDTDPTGASGEMPLRHSRKKEKRFGHN